MSKAATFYANKSLLWYA